MDEALQRLRSGQNHETAAVLTFDDAYENCYTNLLPYLKYYGVPATVFACAGASADGGRHAHDVDNGLHDATLMTSRQLREMREQGIEIGSHGSYHENMGLLTSDELRTAIVESGRKLEAIVRQPVRYFSFPFGKKHHMSKDALEVGQEKYEAMFSAYGGYNFPDVDNQFHFQRISNPPSLSSLVAIMNGLHRATPFYVDRPAELAMNDLATQPLSKPKLIPINFGPDGEPIAEEERQQPPQEHRRAA